MATDDDPVLFDRKTAAVLAEMARWWQTSGGGRPPRTQKTPQGKGSTLRIAEVVDEVPRGVIEYGNVTVKLLHATGEPLEARHYEDLDEGVEVAAVNWLRPQSFDGSTTDLGADWGTDNLKVGQKVLVADMYGTWAVVGILAGAFVDLLAPEPVNDGYGDDFPGVVCTAEAINATDPRRYVVDSLFGLLEKSIGGSSEGDPDTELFALCVKRSSVVESLFLTPLSGLENP